MSIALFTTLVLTSSGYAQSTQELQRVQSTSQSVLLQQVLSDLGQRGLTESQVRLALLERGINVETMSPDQLLQRRAEIESIVESLEPSSREEGSDTLDTQLQLPSEAFEDNQEGLDNMQPSNEVDTDPMASRPQTDIYGHELFYAGGLEDFIVQSNPRIPSSYILAPGDEIRVSLFGTSQNDFLLTINPDGYVTPEQMPKILLAGMPYSQARDVIQHRFQTYYTFSDNQIAIQLQVNQSINVTVLGESFRKGTFALSPLNTAFNALYVAGGPTPIGSVRNIQVIRGEVTTTMDLYSILRKPSEALTLPLREQDILYIPTAKKVVRVEGAVKRPMRYELKEGETLQDLLDFAGGLAADAYVNMIQIERIEDRQLSLLDIPYSALEDAPALKDGDVIRVRSSRQVIDAQITLNGALYYPGSYGFQPGMTLAEALQRAGGALSNAADRAYLKRTNPKDFSDVSYVPISLSDPMDLSYRLQPYDELTVYDRSTYTNPGQVGLIGAVNQNVSFSYDPNLTVQDLFLAAGGQTVGAATNRVQVFRRTLYSDQELELETLNIAVDSSYRVISPATFRLQPFDQLVVRRTPGFQLESSVEINGEVNYPGAYQLENRNVFLSELIAQAGGLRGTASPNGAKLFRELNGRGFIVVDLQKVLERPGNTSFDPILQEGDVITIEKQENTVTFRGDGIRLGAAIDTSLSTTLSIQYQGNQRADWYIENFAGGFNEDANLATVTVIYKNGQAKVAKKRLFGRTYPRVEPGATVLVDRKPLEVLQEEEEPRVDWDQTLDKSLSTLTTVATLIVLIRQL